MGLPSRLHNAPARLFQGRGRGRLRSPGSLVGLCLPPTPPGPHHEPPSQGCGGGAAGTGRGRGGHRAPLAVRVLRVPLHARVGPRQVQQDHHLALCGTQEAELSRRAPRWRRPAASPGWGLTSTGPLPRPPGHLSPRAQHLLREPTPFTGPWCQRAGLGGTLWAAAWPPCSAEALGPGLAGGRGGWGGRWTHMVRVGHPGPVGP